MNLYNLIFQANLHVGVTLFATQLPLMHILPVPHDVPSAAPPKKYTYIVVRRNKKLIIFKYLYLVVRSILLVKDQNKKGWYISRLK